LCILFSVQTLFIPNIATNMHLATAKSLTSRMIKFCSHLILKILIFLLRNLRRMFFISFPLFDVKKRRADQKNMPHTLSPYHNILFNYNASLFVDAYYFISIGNTTGNLNSDIKTK
jgi:hypothetical protein